MIKNERFDRQNIFWTAFLLLLFVPLAGSALSPLPFGFFAPATGVVFFLLHKALFGTWPSLNVPQKGLLPLVGALFALMFLSYFWSFNPHASLGRAEKVSALILACFALLAVARTCPPALWQKYSLLFPFAVFILGAVNVFEVYFDMPIYRAVNPERLDPTPDLINKNYSVFVLALPVALYLAWKGRSILFFLALLVLGVLILFLTSSQACQLALIVILVAGFGCFSFLEKITMRTAFVGLVILFLMMPWVAPTAFDLLATKVADNKGLLGQASMAMRLENWDFLSRRIMENPWTGFGMDTTRYMKFDTQQLYFHGDSIMHPHNAALQMWIEFGILGASWAVAFLVYFYAFLKHLTPSARRLSFLTFCAVMVFMLVSWSIWASWLLAFTLYLAALCILAAKTSTAPSNS